MTFPYKSKVDKCIGRFKVCLPDSIKNISVKSFDLLSEKHVLKNISFHQSCKCGCLLDEKVCNNLQKRNKNKCRCECLKIKKCDICYSSNVNHGVQWGQSYLMGGWCLFSLGRPHFSDGVTIKMPYGVDVLHQPASHPTFFYWVC